MAWYVKANRSLTTLDLSSNSIGGQYVKEAQATGTTFKVGDVVQWNGMEGTISKEKDSDGDIFVHFQQGTQAIAEALEVNRALKSVDLRHNAFPDESCQQLRAAVGNKSITLQLEPQR